MIIRRSGQARIFGRLGGTGVPPVVSGVPPETAWPDLKILLFALASDNFTRSRPRNPAGLGCHPESFWRVRNFGKNFFMRAGEGELFHLRRRCPNAVNFYGKFF